MTNVFMFTEHVSFYLNVYNMISLVAFDAQDLNIKQSNVNEVEECLYLAQSNEHLPRTDGRTNLDITWAVDL